MPRTSAGILLYRRGPLGVEVLLVHPGGPFWANKDEGSWSVVKGEYQSDDAPFDAAAREFKEELGIDPPRGKPIPLGEVRQPGGKRVVAFALEGEFDTAHIESNTFEIEWPPHSGRRATFPEVDRAEWFALEDAKRVLLAAQIAFLDRLVAECQI